MSAIWKRTCRICHKPLPAPFLNLGEHTLANNLVDSPDQGDPRYPLMVVRCGECGLVQLTHVIDPKVLFGHYLYTPSQSATFKRHFKEMAEALTAFLGRTGLAVDIGSNDGLLLSNLQRLGWRVVGVEPAENIAGQANEAGIYTVNKFWDMETASFIEKTKGQADLVTGTNIFAHVDDIYGFVRAVKQLLKPTGIFVIEVPYLPIMLEDGTFDLIYHEHLSYFAVATLIRLFASEGIDVFRVEDVPAHGGSIRVFVQKPNGCYPVDEVAERVAVEKKRGLNDPQVYERFARRVAQIKEEFVGSVRSLRGTGLKLVGYGAPAKANTLINYCGLGAGDIAYIVDDNPLKQGKFLPGSRIPIVRSSRLQEEPPDAIVVFAWNVAQDIIPRLPPAKKVIVPMPVLKVIESPIVSVSGGL